ncbi:MAG: Holliday junction resolvase RuvX [Betaproteobacteria bacterium]|nr:Holliday junction resolvase RuvX [Betaproteobacteria bacterium]
MPEHEAAGISLALAHPPKRGTVLAFDWGTKRLGVAVGDLEVKLAHPLAALGLQGPLNDMDVIEPLVREWRPVLLVVGLPKYDDEREHPLAKKCRTFAQRAHKRFGLPALMVDEAYSSSSAGELLRETGAGWPARKHRTDQVAAQQILETFFELASRATRS